jgi:hypothetical protein
MDTRTSGGATPKPISAYFSLLTAYSTDVHLVQQDCSPRLFTCEAEQTKIVACILIVVGMHTEIEAVAKSSIRSQCCSKSWCISNVHGIVPSWHGSVHVGELPLAPILVASRPTRRVSAKEPFSHEKQCAASFLSGPLARFLIVS